MLLIWIAVITFAVLFIIVLFKMILKKRLKKEMTNLVDLVKMGIWIKITYDIASKGHEESFSKQMASACCNYIFQGKSNKDELNRLFSEYTGIVSYIFSEISKSQDLKNIITDAIIVQCRVNELRGKSNLRESLDCFERKYNENIVLKDKKLPSIESFTKSAQAFYVSMMKKYAPKLYGDTSDVVVNFIHYCKDFLHERSGLTNGQSQLLILDPDLGSEMDKVKCEWLKKDIGFGTDPDTFLIPRLYDAPQMQRINNLLEKYASEFPKREQRIKDYLKSIGHPFGRTGGPSR